MTPFEYCASQGTPVREWIAGVGIGSFNHSSGRSKYSDFTDSVITVYKGKQTSLTLTPGYDFGELPEYWRVWADLNQDSIINGSEILYQGKVTGEVNSTITIPRSAKSGKTRLRVSMSWWEYPGPCGEIYYGEVENYTLKIKPRIFKPRPKKEPVAPDQW